MGAAAAEVAEETAEGGAQSARAGNGRIAAAMAILLVAICLAVLPALIAFGLGGGAARLAVASVASLVAVGGGLKLVAAAWGLAAGRTQGARFGAASVD